MADTFLVNFGEKGIRTGQEDPCFHDRIGIDVEIVDLGVVGSNPISHPSKSLV
jgi:hypothetical protein